MKKLTSLFLALVVLAAVAIPGGVFIVNAYTGIPTISIVSVIVDQKVTVQTDNFPAGLEWRVLMGAYGTQGIGGTLVTTTSSAAGGAFLATFNIPAAFKGAGRVAIRLESTTGGYYAYNWFWNNTTNPTPAPTATPGGPTATPVHTGIPTFSIANVVTDSTVTIQTNNFPAGLEWKVRMGAYGTLGIGGIQVALTKSDAGGSFMANYDIPAALKGSTRIAIRLESTTGGYFAYNWFWNNTTNPTPAPTSAPSGPTTTPVPVHSGIPTFSIKAVVRDSSVTVKTNNFPAGLEWRVLMGAYGTLGIGGVVVANVSYPNGGAFEAAYTIPASLKGSARIAIRLESTSGVYYAYNWFWNNTTP